jgi:hypothetical protein
VEQLCDYYGSDKVKGHNNQYADLVDDKEKSESVMRRAITDFKSILSRRVEFDNEAGAVGSNQ